MEYSDKATGRRSTVRPVSQMDVLGRGLGAEATVGAGERDISSRFSEALTVSEAINGSIGSTEGSGCSAEYYGINRVRRVIIRHPLGR